MWDLLLLRGPHQMHLTPTAPDSKPTCQSSVRPDSASDGRHGEVKCMFSFLVIEWISVLLQFL
ncbi:hypothetical protein SCA6_019142 [Theobroma cacao]